MRKFSSTGNEWTPEDGRWQYRALRSRGNTIQGGTSEIMRNIFALAALESPGNQIYERFIAHSDPNNERTAVVQCSDVGLDKGGWGKILMKVSVERVK